MIARLWALGSGLGSGSRLVRLWALGCSAVQVLAVIYECIYTKIKCLTNTHIVLYHSVHGG